LTNASLNRTQSLFGECQPAVVANTLSLSNTEGDGVFGWYKYIQDFPGSFASRWLESLASPGDIVWEPFLGSGTTMLAAKFAGLKSVGFEQNPFMTDVARTKLYWKLSETALKRVLISILQQYSSASAPEPVNLADCSWEDYHNHIVTDMGVYPSDDKKLAKWIAPEVVRRAVVLRDIIDSMLSCNRIRQFARLALARVLVPVSNMAFRPNICYKARPILDAPVGRLFEESFSKMLSDYRQVSGTPGPSASVRVGDARVAGPSAANVIFTSPPYPNDMEYIHQTRLELSLLGYVNKAKGLTELKKTMISSSVKLVYRQNEWQKALGNESPGVCAVHQCLARTLEGKNWGWNAADMVSQYFGGMHRVFENWHSRLTTGGIAAVVVGDSAFNGVLVKTDVLLAEVAERTGFRVREIDVFRSRWNSKHEFKLRESVLVLTKD